MKENEHIRILSELSVPYPGKGRSDELIAAASRARYILMGEASHGTSEFYTHRAELSKRLIEEHGYRFIAVEGDWPSCYALNRYVKGYAEPGIREKDALRDFSRWPTWMWANEEIAAFAEWLKAYNADRPDREKVGFYGIDLYSLWESMDEIRKYLRTKDGADLEAANRAFECFEPHGREEQQYGISASLYGEGCEDEVIDLLRRLQGRWRESPPGDREQALSAEMNALSVQGAERYYRTMIRFDVESWNVRDRHMVEALEKLMDYHGSDARAIVWEHNTHIGDARATDMAEEGMVNVGQLLREKDEGDVYAIGFGTYEGTVIAARAWGEPLKVMTVPPAIPGSLEELLHRIGPEDKLLLMGEDSPAADSLQLGHRAIGVVYHPERERGNYVPTLIGKRYDAFIYIDRTKALSPLAAELVHP